MEDSMIDLFKPRRGGGHQPAIADLIDASGDCWEWTGSNNGNNYGRVSYGGRLSYVHRLVWEALVGPIPDDMELDHLCRNTMCCNPDHLEVVTHAENMRRGIMVDVARRRPPKTHCLVGHPLRKGQVVMQKNGTRLKTKRCLVCKRGPNAAHMRKVRAIKKEVLNV